ncbi:MAG: PAS domain S-box protein [Myxococcota bacterium]|nr:PAS domain S-box protein [Myxococcota bacterium]
MNKEKERRPEGELQSATLGLRSVVNSAQDAMLIMTLHFVVTEWNDAAERMYGWTAAEAVGMPIASLIPTQYVTQSRVEVRRAFLQDGLWRGEVTQTTRNGHELSVHSSITMVHDEAGMPLGILSINRDITKDVASQKQRQTEREQLLLRAQRSHELEAIGQLTGEIARDLNTLMNTLSTRTGHLADALAADSAVQDMLSELQDTRQQAQQMVGQLLSIHHAQELTPKIINLNTHLSSRVELLNRIVGASIHLNLKPQPGLWQVSVAPSQIEQVLINLALSTREVMPEGGTLIIETTNSVIDSVTDSVTDSALATHRPHLKPGEYVQVRLSSDSSGAGAAAQTRIFESVFTPQKTDLDLATVLNSISQSGGFADCEWSTGQDAFSFYLPRSKRFALDSPVRQEKTKAHLLVVEDELVLRRLLQRALKNAGYTVSVAVNGDEALARYTEEHVTIDLVLTDMVMPKMGGWMLSTKLAALGMRRVVFMSGYTLDGDNLNANESWFIAKPFGIGALLKIIEGALMDENLS